MIRQWVFAMADGGEARVWIDGYSVCLAVPEKMSSLEACILGMGLQEASRIAGHIRARKDLKR